MKYQRQILFVLFGVFSTGLALAQDPQFSQYYNAPLYLNPGFTGSTQHQRVAFNHRLQWPGLPQAFSTFATSYDIYVDELSSGFGILATTDKMGSAGWRTTNVGLLYSFKVRLNDNLVFSPGLNFSYGVNGLDRTKLVLGDGLEFDGISLDPELARIGNKSYFDFSSGFILYSRKTWVGAAFAHMNRPNLSIIEEVNRLPMKVTIQGGTRINIGDHPTAGPNLNYITPSFIFRMQGPFTQLDVGLNYHIDPISVGVWYRGKPFEKNVIGNLAQDALVFQFGFMFDNVQIGYSYDFTVSELETASGGAHEIALIFDFVTTIRKSNRSKGKLIPCPTFYERRSVFNRGR
ncbi:MAG TPA: type IX secretion system membrane protein PorP/SprF [Cyclobacteriaceae bacterium]|nr:type IX secretion system membrane protein PorP/SprF [Cyclobacteriaceae bacterium]